MKTYFAWVREGDTFDTTLHAREDLEILELNIDHREGEVALATLVVARATLPPWDQRNVFISHEETLFFKGRLVGLPLELKNDLVRLELTSEPADADNQLKSLGKEMKKAPFWDSSFVEVKDQDNPSELLEARSALFSWDRTSGRVCISDLFQGKQTLNLTDVFFADSLIVRLAETPLSHVSVNLSVEWIQQGEGEVDLSRRIRSEFVGGMINTLTPESLQNSWPKEGQKIGRSGYWVVKSSLKQVSPPRTGILDIYPTVTPEILSWNDLRGEPQSLRAKRFWMLGRLILGWRYRQKRRETVKFTLGHETQLDGKIRPLMRTLNLCLQQVVPVQSPTFFLTGRGRQAVEHAIEVAKAHLAGSARCLEIELMAPLEFCLDLSMDHSVYIKDPRLPGGEVSGKVIAYQFHLEGLKAYAWIRLAASIGGVATEPGPPGYTYYVEQAYGETGIPDYFQTDSGVCFVNYGDQQPTGGLRDIISNFSINDLLNEVVITHQAENQIQILQRQQYPVCYNTRAVLEDVQTRISFDLCSLKTSAVEEHTIHLHIINKWTAPAQVTLEGGFDEI